MFFDKHYRPERFNFIINQQEKHKNVNEFRTLVMHKFYRFPLKSAAFLMIGGHKVDFAQNYEELHAHNEVSEDKKGQSILIEGKLMLLYNRCFLSELALYSLVAATCVFLFLSYQSNTFNRKVANRFFFVPGMFISCTNVYVR